MYTCGTCWRDFPAGWQSRQQHMDATGHWPPPYECDTCDRFFGSEAAAQQHMAALDHWDASSESGADTASTGDESLFPQHECEFCDDGFDEADDLLKHEVDVHFYCDSCSRHLYSRHNMNQHLQSKAHRRARPQCTVCFEVFVNDHALSQHVKSPVHWPTQYRCPESWCGQEFTTLAGVVSHLESVVHGDLGAGAVQKRIEGMVPFRQIEAA